MYEQLVSKLNKDIGLTAIDKGDISTGILYTDKYINDLDKLIRSNSDNEKYTIEKNNTLDIVKEKLLDIAKRSYSKDDWNLCLRCCQVLIQRNTTSYDVFKHASFCLRNLDRFDTALELMELYSQKEKNDPYINVYLADAYFRADEEKNALTAIDYYKRFLEDHPDDAQAYNSIGNVYASSINYKNSSWHEQLYYFEKALQLEPKDKVIMRNMVLTKMKMGKRQEAYQLYEKLYKIHKKEFTHDDYFDYAAFLISMGEFLRGWNLLDHRFEKEHNNTYYPSFEQKKWDGQSNLAKSTLLVHCEQGFGDNIMYIRFVKEVQKLAKEVIAVIPNEAYALFRESNLGFRIVKRTEDLTKIKFDTHIPIMSLPKVTKLTPDTVPLTQGYLNVSRRRKELYKRKYINTEKFKIGICLEGAPTAKKELRDVDWKYLSEIAKIDGIQLYCFKKDMEEKDFKELDENIDIICLGESFKNFADTAAAMLNMDLMITTDSVILNLAGALGVKTLGLFNQNREYRWYGLEEGRMIWYDSVKPYIAKELNNWQPVIDDVIKEIKSRIEQKAN